MTLKDGTARSFNVSGAKLLETGVADVQFTGNVYNVDKLTDYPAVSRRLTLVEGLTGSAVMTNDNSIYIDLEAKSEGIRLGAPAPGGVLIEFAE